MSKNLFLLTGLLLAFSAQAEPPVKKDPTQIDFNKMIEENDTSDLQKQIAAKANPEDKSQDIKVNEDKKKVLDFVDVEIGLGEGRPVVDRRFNSVKPAEVAQEFTVQIAPRDKANH